jgi:prephenate dehydrogenase
VPADVASPFHRVGIAGLGLIGGSIARELRARRPDVHVIGVDAANVLDAAYTAGIIDERRSTVQTLHDVDIVILAAPVPAIIDMLGELGAAQFDGLATDVGSTKRHILTAAEAAGLTRFVGGHPMAGSERGGFEQSRPGLFEGRPWFLVPPTRGISSDDLAVVQGLVREVGAIPVETDGLSHDRTVAHVSHLPQLLAVALMNTAADACGEAGLEQAGRAFDEMTRLAHSPAELWQGIVDTNRDCIARAVLDLVHHLEPLVDYDTRKLRAAFAEAARHRERYIV